MAPGLSDDDLRRRDCPRGAARVVVRLLPLAAIAVGAALLVLWGTARLGIGISPDSVTYLDVAASIVRGKGLVYSSDGGGMVALTHYPPLYPVVLAGLTKFGMSVSSAARLVAVFSFAALILTLGLILVRAGTPLFVVFAVSLLAASEPALLRVHLMAWSEPLFLLLTLGALGLLARGITSPRTGPWLVGSALVAGLAALDRYLGIVTLGVGLLSLLLWGHWGRWRNLTWGAAYFAIGGGPLALLFTRNLVEGGTASDRYIAVHPVSLPVLQDGLRVLASWVRPAWLGSSAGLIVAALLLSWCLRVLLRGWRGATDDFGGVLLRVALLFASCYLGCLLLSISLADASTLLDERLLAPVLVVSLLALGLALQGLPGRPLAVIAGAVFAGGVIITSQALGAGRLLDEARSSGLGYASVSWRAAPLLRDLQEQRPRPRVFTALPEGIAYLTGIPAHRLPRLWDPVSLRPNLQFGTELRDLCGAVRDGAIIVAFHDTLWRRPYVAPLDTLRRILPLRTLRESQEGMSLGWDSAASAPADCGAPVTRGRSAAPRPQG